MKTKRAKESDPVRHLTELEALQFSKLDTEMRNRLQGLRIADLELERFERAHQDQRISMLAHKQQLTNEISAAKPEYEVFIRKLARKYRIQDPDKMTIDPDVGIIKEL